MKNKLQRSDLKIREAEPKVKQGKKGVEILCPFCQIPHPIYPYTDSPCGTSLKVTAIQSVVSAHATKFNKIVCVKCGKSGGEMVKYMNGFVHLVDCKPDTRLMAEPPKFSWMAGLIYKLPTTLGAKDLIEKITGKAQEVQEIDLNGKETGKVLGHFFLNAIK